MLEGESVLGGRALSILKALIREFVRTGKPVGSNRLARIYGGKLSPATIRNVVANLENAGLAAQPHTSAGRVPTAQGYRVHVDSLTRTRRLAESDMSEIQGTLQEFTDPDVLMNKVSQVLSTLSNNVGFVLARPMSLTTIKHVKFVRMGRRRVMVILVSQTGSVQHKLVTIEEDLAQRELDQAGRYLVTHFTGMTIGAVRDELIKLMSEEKALYDRMLQNVILLGSSAGLVGAQPGSDESEVYLGGTARMIEKTELGDIRSVMVLFEAFEEKNRLVKILSQCVRQEQHRPTVTIGLEKHIPGLSDMTLVASPFVYSGQTSGSLGILGPSRMEYEKTISLVDYMARLFGQVLDHNYRQTRLN